MKETTFYKYAMITMLLLNLILVGFLVINRPSNRPTDRANNRPGDRPTNRQGPPGNRADHQKRDAIKILDMDQDQLELFKASAQRHGMKMDSISQLQSAAMSTYLLDSDAATSQASITQVEKLAGLKLAATNNHFEEIRSILNEDQLVHYQPFIKGVMKNIFPSSKKRQRPPKDF